MIRMRDQREAPTRRLNHNTTQITRGVAMRPMRPRPAEVVRPEHGGRRAQLSRREGDRREGGVMVGATIRRDLDRRCVSSARVEEDAVAWLTPGKSSWLGT